MLISSRTFVFGGLLAAALLSAPAQAEEPPPAAPAAPPALPTLTSAQTDELVKKVQGVYDSTQTFVTTFKQEYIVKAHNEKRNSTGTMTIAKPGKMDFSYNDPKDNRVVSDGATLRLYEAANKQMVEQTIDKAQYPAALSFLAGTGKLADTFNFIAHPGESMKFPGGVVLEGTPKQDNRTLTKVFFYIDKQTNQVRRLVMLDPQGNRNRFDFDAPRVNEPVKPETFRFTPPDGTQIIRP